MYDILDADVVTESSGIIDISAYLDYQPGSIFLTTGFSNNTVVNQLALAVSPTAKLLADAYTDWVASFTALNTAAKRLPSADPDSDGLRNDLEFALDLSPDMPDADAPVEFAVMPGQVNVRFAPAQSLNVVNYYLDYTEDLATGFSEWIAVTAGMIDGAGEATVSLWKMGNLFIRLRVELP